MKTSTPAFAAIIAVLLLASGCSGYQSVGKSSGAYIRSVSGPSFQPVTDGRWLSEQHALIYFYRPDSRWARAELSAPSFYVDDNHFFNLRGNGYTWLEVYPGERQFDIRRPLMGIEGIFGTFDHILEEAVVPLKAGEVYYLRYSELEVPSSVRPLMLDGKQALVSDYAMLVDEATAMEEISRTRLLDSSFLVRNSAATAIVHQNRIADYNRERKLILEERETEIERMKARGHYEPAPWYKPFFNGTLTRPLETDARLKALDQEHKAYLRQASEGDKSGGWFGWFSSR